MIEGKNGKMAFGLFSGLPYGDLCTENYEDYLSYKNKLSRETIEAHIQTLEIAHSPMGRQYDTVLNVVLDSTGMYHDGKFTFPMDFLRYYRAFDIGIPSEYEEYLINTVGLK